MTVVAAAGAALVAAGVSALVFPPTARLAHRVRPYTQLARARLHGHADLIPTPPMRPARGAVARVFGPPTRAATGALTSLVDRRDDATLELALRRAGDMGVSAADHRARVAGSVLRWSALGATVGIVALHSAPLTIALVALGTVCGASRARGALDRRIRDRAERMRIELYTVNQLLAMHVRSGAGPIQAVQRIVDRGAGAVVDELAAVLLAVRRGESEPAAFRHAAEVTAEPAAARTYKLFAAGAERGVDLAGGLRALSEDLRDARREEIRATATKRRAAMLVPTIAVLAPVMLLFIAAPLPSVVLGSR
ncbi:MAG TPA: type II secretion system F family protein [Acidimicrobiia bacterium]|nr:type II secretion system F family protein [Acidimicrobiia bacterium]